MKEGVSERGSELERVKKRERKRGKKAKGGN
jgi:hypothetical protein